jgi:hypothetical protein
MHDPLRGAADDQRLSSRALRPHERPFDRFAAHDELLRRRGFDDVTHVRQNAVERGKPDEIGLLGLGQV